MEGKPHSSLQLLGTILAVRAGGREGKQQQHTKHHAQNTIQSAPHSCRTNNNPTFECVQGTELLATREGQDKHRVWGGGQLYNTVNREWATLQYCKSRIGKFAIL